MTRNEAYQYTKQFVEEAEKLNDPVFSYGQLNLLRASRSEIYICLLNYFSPSPKPWTKPGTAGSAFAQWLRKIKNGGLKGKVKGRKVIFFHISSANHIKQQYPVVKELQKRGYGILFISNKKNLAQRIRKLDLPVINCIPTGAMPANNVLHLHRVIKDLMGKISWLTSDLAIRFSDIIESVYPTATAYSSEFQKAIRRYKPELLIVGNDILRDGYLVTEIGRQNGIKTAGIMHALMTDESPLHYNIGVDYYFLFGEYFRPFFNKFGMSDERLFACGAPSFGSEAVPVGVDINQKLGIPVGEKYVLVAFSGPGHSHPLKQHTETIQALHEAIKQMPHTYFVVKLHPKDSKEHYTDIINAGYRHVKIVADSDKGFENLTIVSYLASAKVLVSVVSTTIFEAMFLNIPALSIDIWDEYSTFDYLSNSLIWRVKSAEEAVAALQQMMDTTNVGTGAKVAEARKFAESVFGANDGKAPERIADTIAKVII